MPSRLSDAEEPRMPSRLSRAEQWGARLLAGELPPTPLTCALLAALAGCAVLYDIGLEAYLGAERVGLRRRVRLPVPVISIGNLTVGGTGKTPMTQLLCRTLLAAGHRPAVLSRGHGSKGPAVRIVSDGQGRVLLADEAGDEPVLLARTLPGVPVLVGKDRRASGRAALVQFAPTVLVLDDGFQYWQLARDLDIVLLDARRPFDNGFVLPRGLLREPKRHLGRAQMVVVTRAQALDTDGRHRLARQIHRLAPRAELFWADHVAQGFVPVGDLASSLLPLDMLQGQSVVALSGIAQPASFLHALTHEAHTHITHSMTYPDHATYSLNTVTDAAAALQSTSAVALVMTEKDAVKWPALPSLPVPAYALRTALCVEDTAQWAVSVLHRVSNTSNSV